MFWMSKCVLDIKICVLDIKMCVLDVKMCSGCQNVFWMSKYVVC